MIRISRKSPITGKTYVKDMDITIEQYEDWKNGMLAQLAFPDLNADDREFIITGITPEEFRMLEDEEDGDCNHTHIAEENEDIED